MYRPKNEIVNFLTFGRIHFFTLPINFRAINKSINNSALTSNFLREYASTI